MLAAKNGHKYVVLILAQRGANLDLVNEVRVDVHRLYYKTYITQAKVKLFFSIKRAIRNMILEIFF